MSSPTYPREVAVFGAFEIDLSQFDLNDRSSRVNWISISSCIFIALVTLAVGLRIFARARFIHKIFPDDVLIIFAAAFTIALAAACVAATNHGLGTHVWLLPMHAVLEEIKSCVMYLYICQVLYAFAIALTKLAITSSYLRFIHDKAFRWSMCAILTTIIGLWVTGVFITIFQCRPVSGAWELLSPDRQCIDYIDYLYASSVINVLTDILLCVLPWPHLWGLNMPLKQRIVLCVLLAGGASACIVGIIRIAYLDTLRNADTTYQAVPCLILSVTECSLGIISVSIPALRPLAQHFFPSMRTPTISSQRRSWHIRLDTVRLDQHKPVSNAVKQGAAASTSLENLTQDSN